MKIYHFQNLTDVKKFAGSFCAVKFFDSLTDQSKN